MPDNGFLIYGFITGFLIALPLGPVAALCIRTTVERGWAAGFATGLGVALADSIFGAVAAFGVTFIIDFLRNNIDMIRLAGGIFLLYIAYKTAQQHGATRNIPAAARQSLIAVPGMTFLVTLSNPVTVFAFIGVFAVLDIAADGYNGALLVLGIFLGSMTWWALLSSGVNAFRARISDAAMKRINIFSAGAIMIFGVFVLYAAARGFMS